jgi:predicted DNA-binding transcriptional regulator AlpA
MKPVSTPTPTPKFLRIDSIVGNKKKGIVGILPISKSTWWAGVKSGRYPKPVKISIRCTAWLAEEVDALEKSFSSCTDCNDSQISQVK